MAIPASAVEDARRGLASAPQEDHFWRDRFPALLAQYPDQFVAVNPQTKQVIAASPDLPQLLAKLEAAGHPVRDVWLRFITDELRRALL